MMWEAAGRPGSDQRPGREGSVAQRSNGTSVVRYDAKTPGPDIKGDIEAVSMWAGQGVGLVCKQQSAAEIIEDLMRGAQHALQSAAGS